MADTSESQPHLPWGAENKIGDKWSFRKNSQGCCGGRSWWLLLTYVDPNSEGRDTSPLLGFWASHEWVTHSGIFLDACKDKLLFFCN